MFDTILAPSDGSSYALEAAGYGADLAAKYESEVTIVYVAELPPVIGIAPSDQQQMEIRHHLSEQGDAAIRKTREVYERAGVQPKDQLVFGSAVPDILRIAREGKYDLMVIGARGKGSGAIEQMLLGSVAEGILHSAPCPILMIRPH